MRRSAFCVAGLLAAGVCPNVSAAGPFAVISGRWEPVVIVVDLDVALDPVNDATSNAVISRVRVTQDIDTNGDGIPDVPAAGLPSNVVIGPDGETALVVNHAGNATPADVAEFPHGHPGTITVLDLRAALDPANNDTTNAIEVVMPTDGYGPVGFALADDGRTAFVGSSEGDGNEDGGVVISIIDLRDRAVRDLLQLPLGSGGKITQDSGLSCADLLLEPSRVPHELPDANVGCFPDINAIGINERFIFTANGGTDDVSVIDVQRAIDGASDIEVARVPVERGPWGLAVSPDGNLVAVTNRESAETGLEGNTISILDIRNAGLGRGAEVARVVVGTDDIDEATRPFGLAFTPDGQSLIVANSRSNNVSVVDVGEALAGSENAERARVALTRPDGDQARPRGIAITADGQYVAISGGARDATGGGSLWVVDLESLALVATVTGVGNEPYLLAIAP